MFSRMQSGSTRHGAVANFRPTSAEISTSIMCSQWRGIHPIRDAMASHHKRYTHTHTSSIDINIGLTT